MDCMKAFQIQNAWGLKNLKQAELAVPEPGPGEVLVRVRAVSLNFRDHLVIHGHYNPNFPIPLIPCSDGAGEIAALGAGVTVWKEGDRVVASGALNWLDGSNDRTTLKQVLGGPLDGTLRECMVVPASSLLPIPKHLDFEEAATLPCAAVTAWSALMTHGNLRAGDTVLALGTGGVSVFSLQLAKLAGARVIITSSSDEKLERARSLGADAVINYKSNPDWEKRVYELTEGRGVDHVIEVGGAGTLEKSLRSVRPGGTVSLIGVLAGGKNDVNLLPVLMHNICVQGIFVGHKASFAAMNRAIELHELRPVVDQVFDFGDAPKALIHLARGQHFGKIVIRVS